MSAAPLSSVSSTASSTASSATSSSTTPPPAKAKSFWPRELVFGSPHPSQLTGGRQLDAAPMCPCHDCWEYGSHAVASAVRRAAKEEKKQARAAAAAAAASDAGGRAPALASSKKSGLHFLRRSNPSRASVASDARPLRQSVTLASPPASLYEHDYDYES